MKTEAEQYIEKRMQHVSQTVIMADCVVEIWKIRNCMGKYKNWSAEKREKQYTFYADVMKIYREKWMVE